MTAGPGAVTAAGTVPADRPLPARPAPSAVDAAERGTTTIADRVVEKIAGRAALDVTHAAGLRRRVAGRQFGTPTVRVQAEVDGHLAALRMALAVEYPAPVRTTTRAVRAHVTDRVHALCGLTVDHVDITVAVLRRPDQERKRVQ